MEIRELALREGGALDESGLLPLYAAVGWTNYTGRPDMLRAAYQNSLCALGAYEGGRLAGAVRAVGDGASIVYVQDLLVLPEYQRRGIGAALVRALMARYPAVYQLVLLTDDTEKTAAFYRSLGLSPVREAGCLAFWKMNAPNGETID